MSEWSKGYYTGALITWFGMSVMYVVIYLSAN